MDGSHLTRDQAGSYQVVADAMSVFDDLDERDFDTSKFTIKVYMGWHQGAKGWDQGDAQWTPENDPWPWHPQWKREERAQPKDSGKGKGSNKNQWQNWIDQKEQREDKKRKE